MIRLLRTVHWASWRRSRWSLALPILGVALGVAAIVAIDLGSSSTVDGARWTLERLEGRATHQILPATGRLDPALAWQLRGDGVLAAPVLELIALGEEPLRVIGLDAFAEADIRQLGLEESTGASDDLLVRFLAEPGGVLVSTPYLNRHDLEPGDSVEILVGAQRATAHVLAALPQSVDGIDVPDNLMLCDIATAQEFSGRSDATRIDLVVPKQERGPRIAQIEAQLPEGLRLERPGGRAQQMEGMLAALNANLRALSYLALFVSLFLIYNAMLLAVLRRRAQIGLVRCLGATRGEVMGAWLVEGLVIGLAGTALGLALGTLGGRWAVQGFAQTSRDLYGVLGDSSFVVSWFTYGKAATVGLLASLLTAAFPAAEAAATPPARTASRADVEHQARERMNRAPWFSIPFLLAFVGSILYPSESPALGYVAAVSFALALALVTPSLGSLVLGWLRPVFRRTSIVSAMAAENIRASLSRTGVALAALTVALSMSIAMGTMITSFRVEMLDWIGEVLFADIYLSAATAEVDRLEARLPDELLERLAARETVERVETFRVVPARIDGFDTYLGGFDAAIGERADQFDVMDGPEPRVFLDRVLAGQAGITEALSRRLGLNAGDMMRVHVAGLPHDLRVAGVYRDYSSDRGNILTELSTWKKMAGDLDANSVALILKPGVDREAELEALRTELNRDYALLLRSNGKLREQAQIVFQRTFSVANALQGIGVAVASIGILAALLAFLLERKRELATLRAVGLRRDQLRSLLWTESGMLAVLAWIFALAGGTTLSWVLLRVINVRSFGWSLPMSLPWDAWALHLAFALLAATLATGIPLILSRRASIAAGLREE